MYIQIWTQIYTYIAKSIKVNKQVVHTIIIPKFCSKPKNDIFQKIFFIITKIVMILIKEFYLIEKKTDLGRRVKDYY